MQIDYVIFNLFLKAHFAACRPQSFDFNFDPNAFAGLGG